MYSAAVHIDLVGLLGLEEDGLGLMALLGGEDVVSLCSSDRERTGYSCKLVFVDEADIVSWRSWNRKEDNTYEG